MAWDKETMIAPCQLDILLLTCMSPLPTEVHESDMTANYELLKEYLLAFASSKLPSAEDQKASCQPQCGHCNCFPKSLLVRHFAGSINEVIMEIMAMNLPEVATAIAFPNLLLGTLGVL